MSIRRQDVVWFALRNAGQSAGYGVAVAVLYPNKDAIETLSAAWPASSARNRIDDADAAPVAVTGKSYLSSGALQNPVAYTRAITLRGSDHTARGEAGGAFVLDRPKSDSGKAQCATYCQGCHSVSSGAALLAGPSLVVVFGAKAASSEYTFCSTVLSEADIAWYAQNRDRYLEPPASLVPATSMVFGCIEDPTTRRAIIAYLASPISGSQSAGE